MRNNIIITLVILCASIIACNNANTNPNQNNNLNTASKIINPNGDSELALLMRAMFDDAMQMKAKVQAGEKAVCQIPFERIITAEATEPEKAASDAYQAFAAVYLSTMNELEKVSTADSPQQYTQMVNNCMACHQALCPGPMVRIKKLFL